ncbi:MAG: arginyltransferase [Gammaproteobacteria bacterium]
MTSVPLLLSPEHPCSYLEGQFANALFVHPGYPLSADLYERLLAQGFRRSGDDVYAPRCAYCSACLPVRIEAGRFEPDRSQERCLKMNADTVAVVKPAVFEQSQYDMYLRYQQSRHKDGAMAYSSPEDYVSFLGCSWCDTRFVEFSVDGELACVAVVDQFNDAMSAVYTFFDPKFSRFSPGVYAVLWQIREARRQQKRYLYLGYLIKACKKMAYKSRYQPLQIYKDHRWIEYDPVEDRS